jgi:acetyl-CoA C-acetyltransferase
MGTMFGGNYNQVVVNDTAEAITRGEFDLVLITGAEVGYSSAKANRLNKKLSYRNLPGDYDTVEGRSQLPEHHDFERSKGIRQAIQIYPMYENAIRYHRAESIPAHQERISALWASFSQIASSNPDAWLKKPVSAETIRTASSKNRRVSIPYTKLMNSNNAVDMGAALIMCSTAKAKTLGIPESKWVYPYAGVEGNDHFSASVRNNFHSSPAIKLVGQRLFELTGMQPGDFDYIDLYSCFPAAVQIAAQELGIPEATPLSVTGGLTFGGGPLNNYVMHSIARTVNLLRKEPNKTALVTANGGNLYKQAMAIYSGVPPVRGFKRDNVQKQLDALPGRQCLPEYRGRVTIESYTVMFNQAQPAVAHLSCINESHQRVWVNCHDPDLVQAMTEQEFCGRAAMLNYSDEISMLS